jgi:hypothetical protein
MATKVEIDSIDTAGGQKGSDEKILSLRKAEVLRLHLRRPHLRSLSEKGLLSRIGLAVSVHYIK